jgi:hypothetical protein
MNNAENSEGINQPQTAHNTWECSQNARKTHTYARTHTQSKRTAFKLAYERMRNTQNAHKDVHKDVHRNTNIQREREREQRREQRTSAYVVVVAAESSRRCTTPMGTALSSMNASLACSLLMSQRERERERGKRKSVTEQERRRGG